MGLSVRRTSSNADSVDPGKISSRCYDFIRPFSARAANQKLWLMNDIDVYYQACR